MRTIAIGDIHGCRKAFDGLLQAIRPQSDDTIVPLGDYVDRGSDSKGVIDRLIRLRDICKLKPIMGNHELMMLRAIGGKDDLRMWIRAGGAWTLKSYGWHAQSIGCSELRNVVPYEHMSFIAGCLDHYEDEENIFVHANYDWDADMDQQTEKATFWTHLNEGSIPPPHKSGKTVWVGHTPQRLGKILDLGHVVCLDTHGFRTGWVTAVDVKTRHMWQANENGEVQYTYPELYEWPNLKTKSRKHCPTPYADF